MSFEELFKMGEFISKSGMFGCQTIAQGAVIAQHCEHIGISWLQWQSDFDMVSGKPRMKAEAMLRRLRDMGGKYKWLTASDDATKAVIEITFDGETIQATFTIEQAEKAGLIKKDGAWHTQRPAMLRARASTIGTRMIAPEALGGFATVEEAEEIDGTDGAVSATGSTPGIDEDVSPPKAKRGPGRPPKNKDDEQQQQQSPATTEATAAATPVQVAGTVAVTAPNPPANPAAIPETAPAVSVTPVQPAVADPPAPPAVDPRIQAIKDCAAYRTDLGISDQAWAVVMEKINCPADDNGKRTLLKADEPTIRKVLAWLIKQSEAKRAKDADKSAEEWAANGMPTGTAAAV